jgi:hypothetical protein
MASDRCQRASNGGSKRLAGLKPEKLNADLGLEVPYLLEISLGFARGVALGLMAKRNDKIAYRYRLTRFQKNL